MKLGIKNKLMAMVISLLGVSILTIGLVSVNMGASALSKQTNTDVIQYTTEGANHIGAVIAGNLKLLAETCNKTGVNTMDWNIQVAALTDEVSKLGYQDIAVMDLNGHAKYVTGGGEFDSAKQFWYEAGFRGETAISDVSVSKVTNEPVIFDVAPIKNNGQVVGLLIGRRDPTFLKTITNTLGDGQNKYGFIINNSGGFMAYPDDQVIYDQENVLTDSDNNGKWSSLGSALKNKGESQTGEITYKVGSDSKIGAYASVPGTTWTLVVAQYESAVMSPIHSLIYITLFIAFAMLVLSGIIAYLLSRRMSGPIVKLRDIFNRLAVGDIDVSIEFESSDEIGDMVIAFNKMVDNTKRQAEEAKRMSEGDFITPIVALSEEDVLSHSLITLRKEMLKVHDIVETVGSEAKEGNFKSRGNLDDFAGGFKDLVGSLNGVIDTFVKPIKVANKAIERIGRGEIPPKITTEYKGDFRDLKNNINACVDGLGALKEGNDVLGLMATNDLSLKIEGSYLGIYADIATSINEVHRKLYHIVGIAENIAGGDLCDLEGLQEKGPQSENDRLIPSLVEMLENIQNLVGVTNQMALTAVEGDLSSRGDASLFKGEYIKVIKGFNQTLDAVTEPITIASAVLDSLSNGNLHVKMEGDFKGEHGRIKQDLNKTIDFLRVYVEEISNTLAAVGSGDLSVSIKRDYIGDFKQIKNSINNITYRLSSVMQDIASSADQVEMGARQIADGSQMLAQGSTEQASSIEELTASIEEVTDEVTRSAKNANDANLKVINVKKNAQDGNAQMDQLMLAMEAIQESSNNISKVIKVIDDIAFQTNILSLNASVEAARAGEHGKGFAVVAEEVRVLAARSAEAVHETTILIEDSIEKVSKGTKVAGITSGSLESIVNDIERVSKIINDIATDSYEQAAEIRQINQGIEQVSVVVQANSATAEESAASSEELSSQAQLLKGMMDTFTISN